MPKIIAHNVCMSYPISSGSSFSLKKKLIHFFTGQKESVTISSLENISFSLFKGDRLGVIGVNGAGKSTLLKIISGIYTPHSGALIVNGNVSSLLSLQYGMKPWATGYENIRLRCLLNDFEEDKIIEITRDIEAFTELGDALKKPVNTYSSGMSLRLAFAMATSKVPDILVLDEVIGTGDEYFLEKANNRMESFIDYSNVLVLASHSENIIRKFCNKVLWMHQGHIKMFGNTDNVFNAYNDYIHNISKKRYEHCKV